MSENKKSTNHIFSNKIVGDFFKANWFKRLQRSHSFYYDAYRELTKNKQAVSKAKKRHKRLEFLRSLFGLKKKPFGPRLKMLMAKEGESARYFNFAKKKLKFLSNEDSAHVISSDEVAPRGTEEIKERERRKLIRVFSMYWLPKSLTGVAMNLDPKLTRMLENLKILTLYKFAPGVEKDIEHVVSLIKNDNAPDSLFSLDLEAIEKEIYNSQMISLFTWLDFLRKADYSNEFKILVLDAVLHSRTGWESREQYSTDSFPLFNGKVTRETLNDIYRMLQRGDLNLPVQRTIFIDEFKKKYNLRLRGHNREFFSSNKEGKDIFVEHFSFKNVTDDSEKLKIATRLASLCEYAKPDGKICVAGLHSAIRYLEFLGDIYVFLHTKNEFDTPVTRPFFLVRRMPGKNKIAEVSGTEVFQLLDPRCKNPLLDNAHLVPGLTEYLQDNKDKFEQNEYLYNLLRKMYCFYDCASQENVEPSKCIDLNRQEIIYLSTPTRPFGPDENYNKIINTIKYVRIKAYTELKRRQNKKLEVDSEWLRKLDDEHVNSSNSRSNYFD